MKGLQTVQLHGNRAGESESRCKKFSNLEKKGKHACRFLHITNGIKNWLVIWLILIIIKGLEAFTRIKAL